MTEENEILRIYGLQWSGINCLLQERLLETNYLLRLEVIIERILGLLAASDFIWELQNKHKMLSILNSQLHA